MAECRLEFSTGALSSVVERTVGVSAGVVIGLATNVICVLLILCIPLAPDDFIVEVPAVAVAVTCTPLGVLYIMGTGKVVVDWLPDAETSNTCKVEFV